VSFRKLESADVPLANKPGDPANPRHQLKFRRLHGPYAIARLAPDTPIPAWATNGEFTSFSRSREELSVVCPADNVPPDVDLPHRWVCLKLEGPFPFEQTGVLLSFVEPLSSNGVPIFAVSTYDTDYVLIPEDRMGGVVDLLQAAGHQLV
jgi:hypothetical protein